MTPATRSLILAAAAALAIGASGQAMAGSLVNPNTVMLNPQPLPPKAISRSAYLSRYDTVALNPQPLPPKTVSRAAYLSRYQAVALNPQPLPPKALGR